MFAIYKGKGALWPQKKFTGSYYQRISSKQILEGFLEDFSIFIMPGGQDRPYHAALQGEGNRKIRQFVEQGGIYVGICAGAYYGCKRIEFDRSFPLEVCEERELSFFSGTAIGPAFGRGTFAYGSEKGARIVQIGTKDAIFQTYYNGGCFFEGDFKKVQILARYLELPRTPPAIIQCPIGAGSAILSGVHLEKLLTHLSQDAPADQVKMQMIDRLTSIGAVIGQ